MAFASDTVFPVRPLLPPPFLAPAVASVHSGGGGSWRGGAAGAAEVGRTPKDSRTKPGSSAVAPSAYIRRGSLATMGTTQTAGRTPSDSVCRTPLHSLFPRTTDSSLPSPTPPLWRLDSLLRSSLHHGVGRARGYAPAGDGRSCCGERSRRCAYVSPGTAGRVEEMPRPKTVKPGPEAERRRLGKEPSFTN